MKKESVLETKQSLSCAGRMSRLPRVQCMYVCMQAEFPHENGWKNILVSVQHTCLEWAGTLNPKP